MQNLLPLQRTPKHQILPTSTDKEEELWKDRISLMNLMKLCQKEKNVYKARRIHAQIIKKNLIAKDAYIASALITTYAKCGSLEKAEEVFWKLPERNVVPWSALISGYSQNGLGHEALKCFRQMQRDQIQPNAVTYASVLKACGIIRSLEIGEGIAVEVRKQGLLEKDVVLGTSLVDMYAKCGDLDKAREVFEQLPVRNIVSWNALITGYVHHGLGNEALKFFRQMQDLGVIPNVITYICVLKACGIVGSIEIGKDIDAEVRKQGLLQKDAILTTTLVDMYFKCGAIGKAQEVFEQFPTRNVVCWSAMINGYAQHGLGNEALKCFKHMQDARIVPNVVTFICILKACGIVRSLEIGQDIDAEVRRRGLLEKDVVLGNALVDMYAKCGALDKAREVFEKLPVRNVVTWSSLMAGYVQYGLGDEALKCFREIGNAVFSLDGVTYTCILKACGLVGSLEIGEDICTEVRRQGLLEKDVVLGTALVDMYSKCGDLEKAREVFECLPIRNVVSWSALIAGHAQSGQANAVLFLYKRMKAEGVIPNSVTFVVLLTACTHAGLVKEGEKLFHEMWATNHLHPMLEHYTCMIDLFCRAARMDKVNALLEKVSHSCHLPLFLTILGACIEWKNVKLGRWAFEQSIALDKNCASAYVFMQNLYAAVDVQMEVDEIEAPRVKDKGMGFRIY